MLIKAKANLEADDSVSINWTALAWAALKKNAKACKILLQAGAQIPQPLKDEAVYGQDIRDYLDKVITELNAENRKNAEFIQEFLALQPAGTILPVMDALNAELDTKQYPLASEVIAARKIQRAGRGMQTRKNPKKIIQENL